MEVVRFTPVQLNYSKSTFSVYGFLGEFLFRKVFGFVIVVGQGKDPNNQFVL